jgi:hypothetical protein
VQQNRSGWLVAACLAILATAAAIGALAVPGLASTSGSQPEPPAPTPAEVAAVRDHEAQLASPQAKQERVDSRRRYANESQSQAVDTAKGHFDGTLTSPTWSQPPLRPGEHLRYTGVTGALATQDGVKGAAVVESKLPFQSKVGSGRLAPVDLSLRDGAGGLVPVNPNVPVTIARDVAGGTSFDRIGVGFNFVAADASAPEETVSDKAFFANVDTDTDIWSAPTALGAETFAQLRSVDSPEELDFRFRLPAGAHLALSAEDAGAAEVLGADGKPLLALAPPLATDSDQQQVPTRYEVAGDVLKLVVSHRDGDFLYPILVDPSAIEYDDWQDYGTGIGTRYWVSDTNNSPSYWGIALNNSYWGAGLYLQSYATWYADGWWASWSVYPVRPTILIPRVDYRSTFGPDLNCAYSPCLNDCNYKGMWAPGGPSGFGFYVGDSYDEDCGSTSNHWDTRCARASDCGWDAGAYDNRATFGIVMRTSGTRDKWSVAALQQADVYYWDNVAPDLGGVNGFGTRPWADTDSVAVSGSAAQNGIGLKGDYPNLPPAAQLNSPGTSWTSSGQWGRSCDGTHFNPCDTSVPTNWTVNSTDSGLAGREGIIPINVTATSYTNISSTKGLGYLRIDRSPPSIGLSDSLWNDSQSNSWVGTDANLHVNATDGANDGNGADARSGVKSVEIDVDGNQVDYATNASPCDSCSLARDWNFHTADWGDGSHTVTVTATDQLGHSATRSFTFNADASEPLTQLSGSLEDADTSTVYTDQTYDIEADAADGDSGSPESGVKSIEVDVDGQQQYYDSQACSSGSCEMDRTWTMDPSKYSDGQHAVDVLVTDFAGNVDDEKIDITVQTPSNQPPQTEDTSSSSSSAPPRIDGAMLNDRSGSALVDVGDVNADGIDDYAIGAPQASNNLRAQSGSVYVIFGSSSSSTVDLSNLGTRGFRIDGALPGDLAGSALAGVGDVNGDGIADIAIGAPRTSVDAGIGARGAVYVVFGSPSTGNLDLAALGTRGFTITGPLASASPSGHPFGSVLGGPMSGAYASSGDVNGDGLADVVIGSSTDSNNARLASGSAYVVFGKADTAPVDTTALGPSGFEIDGAAANDGAGYSAAIVGDVNDDGYADIVVGAPGANYQGRTAAGTAYVVFGRPGTNPVDLAALGTQGYAIYGASGDGLGSSVAAVGDIDADNFADFAVGGNVSYVLYGTDEPPTQIDLPNDPYDGYRITPPAGETDGAAVVAGAGDLNGDDMTDVLVGYPNAASGAGAAYAVFTPEGPQRPTGTQVDLGNLPAKAGVRVTGASSGDHLGSSLAALEDSGDGSPGFLVGAPDAGNNGRAESGSTYLVRASTLDGYSSQATAAGSDPGAARDRHNCYLNKTPAYTYNKPSDQPSCRKTDRADRERTPQTPGHGNARRQVKHRLAGTPPSGDPGWPLLDSFGQPVAYVAQDGLHKFRIFDEGKTYVGHTTSRAFIEVQGRACMSSSSLEHQYAQVVVMADYNHSLTPDGKNHIDLGVRGFLDRGALPTITSSRHDHDWNHDGKINNNDVIDHYRTNCGPTSYLKSGSGSQKMYPQPVTLQGYPGQSSNDFSTNDDYQGHRVDTVGPTKEKRCDASSPKCGGQYVNYLRPLFDSDVVILTSATTGVQGGGIVRGLARIGTDAGTSGNATRQLDQIDYTDHNVPCGLRYVAQWLAVDANTAGRHMIGWVPAWAPERNADGTIKTRTGGTC